MPHYLVFGSTPRGSIKMPEEWHWKKNFKHVSVAFSLNTICQNAFPSPFRSQCNGNVFWQISFPPKAMGTCFGNGNVFWQIENGENATGTHFQKRIFWAFKGLVWSQGSVSQMGEVPRVPKIPLTHFWPNAGKTCFDKLVLICRNAGYQHIGRSLLCDSFSPFQCTQRALLKKFFF